MSPSHLSKKIKLPRAVAAIAKPPKAELLAPPEPPWPLPVKILGAGIAAFGLIAVTAVALHQTFLDWDSYMFLNGARTMLGWKGAWLNAYAHPICPFMYSWLLKISRHWNNFSLELRWACYLNAAWTIAALGTGMWWLRLTFQRQPWFWVFAAAIMTLNAIVVEYAATPLTDFIAMFLGTAGVIAAIRAARENSLEWRILAAVIFGLAVPFKYQMWSVALVGMALEWLESVHEERLARFKRLIPYAAVGFGVSVAVQIFLWTAHPPLHTSDPMRIFREFILYYKDAQIAPGSRQPPWEYIFIIRDYFGWPALAALALGLAAAWSGPPLVRANALWLTIYVVSLFIYGTKTKRYVPQFMVPLSALIAYGVSLIPDWGPIRARALRLTAAIAISGYVAILAVDKIVWMLGPYMSDPMWVSLGTWIRERQAPGDRLILLEGGSSWATFATQMTPSIEYAHSQWVRYPPTAWPVNVVGNFKNRDLIIASPRKTDDEFITMQVFIEDLKPKFLTSGGIMFAGDHGEPILLERRGAGRWKFRSRPRTNDLWLGVLTDGSFSLFPRNLDLVEFDERLIKIIAGIRRLRQDFKYHALRR
ncbi:MAG: hypothetical protein HY547_05705 [Elusimicrobia bacterium]|nr:hypothetical protein [Elusimicrobiota bacterium]